MIWYWMGFLLVLHVYLWGLGLTWLIVPRRWRRFWPAFCAPVGLALQSAVVWAGAHTSLPGTDSYARTSLVLPVGLLLAAVAVRRPGKAWRLLAGLRRWWAVAAVMAFSVGLQVYPFTRPPRVLTSIAMTSCDAADYAAGARVFKEFSRGDRTGYLGVAEPVKQLGVDNFYDFWLRINHFSPSAIIALDASLFRQSPYQLVTLLGVVLLTLHLPGVFWLARSAFRFGQVGSLAVTMLYGVSPALFYAMYQVALGQLLAAPAVAMLTWAGIQAFRGPGTLRRYAGYSGLILVGNWLVLGSYNFFLVFAYVPVVAYIGLCTLVWGRWARAFGWAVFVGANLVVCSLCVPERVVSMAQRFFLFNKTPFGWPIPGFYPSGWYGAFADVYLHPAGTWWASAVAVLCLAALAGALVWRGRHGARGGLLAGACTLPIFFGYWLLLREDQRLHDNASYDAYKLFTVFYPGILISLCLWVRAAAMAGTAVRAGAAALWAILLFVNLSGDTLFNAYIRQRGLRVDPSLVAISRAETAPEVQSVNVYPPAAWDRLWGNCFLLRKTQFFPFPTYEGRPVTPALGQWDLQDRKQLVTAHHAGEENPIQPDERFNLSDRRDARFLSVRLDTGWYPAETLRGVTWRWGGRSPQVLAENPHAAAVDCRLKLSIHSLNGRTLRLCTGQRCWWEGEVGPEMTTIRNVRVTFPPGPTLLRFDSPGPADRNPGDVRALTFVLFKLNVDVLAPPPANR